MGEIRHWGRMTDDKSGRFDNREIIMRIFRAKGVGSSPERILGDFGLWGAVLFACTVAKR